MSTDRPMTGTALTEQAAFEQEFNLAKQKAGRAAQKLATARNNTEHGAEVEAFKLACDELNRVHIAWNAYRGFYGPGARG